MNREHPSYHSHHWTGRIRVRQHTAERRIPEYAGVKLLLHYNFRPDAETLVQLGTLWTLGDSPAQHPDAFLRQDGNDDRRPNITRALGREGRTDFGPKKPRPIPPGPDSAFNMVWDTDYV